MTLPWLCNCIKFLLTKLGSSIQKNTKVNNDDPSANQCELHILIQHVLRMRLIDVMIPQFRRTAAQPPATIVSFQLMLFLADGL